MNNWSALVEGITDFIKKKVSEANTRGVVVGVSGGVDSACVACLSKKALGADRVTGIIMPEKGTTRDEDVEDAISLCKKLGIGYKVIEINPFVDAFLEELGKGSEIAIANIKPRIRMIILYFFANSRNLLVMGTGNKTELSVGYFTKYGDGGVDILPIGDLYKTEVFKLAEFLGVPEKIIKKRPSAGLWRGQSDEEEMGITYEKLDRILKAVESGIESQIDGIEKEEIERVVKMIELSKHKRQMPPVAKVRSFLK
jgi:NAD+ synthase